MASRILHTPARTAVELERMLDFGEHAEIWLVCGQPASVAKLFRAPTAELERKLAAMIEAPVEPGLTSVSVAWPTALLYHAGRFGGYLMPRVIGASAVSHAPEALHARDRDFRQLTTRDAYLAAAELARTVSRIHDAGHVVGNFAPESAVWHDDGGVALVSTDTYCIRSRSGEVHPPRLRAADYLPDEIRELPQTEITWAPSHDAFGLAIHIRALLNAHRPGLPPAIRRAFGRVEHAASRPSPTTWAALLDAAAARLIPCPSCGYQYADELRRCPRCSAPLIRASWNKRRVLLCSLAAFGLAAAVTWKAGLLSQTKSREGTTTTKYAEIAGMQPGGAYVIVLHVEAGSPRSHLLSRGDDRIVLEPRIRDRGAAFAARWPSGSALLSPAPATATDQVFEQTPSPIAWKEGWRGIRLTLSPAAEWDAVYRLPWSALGLTLRESKTAPRLTVAALAEDSPASEARLAPGERFSLPELRSHAEPTRAELLRALESVAGSAVTLRVFSGQPRRFESFIATGDFKPKLATGEYLRVEAVGGGSRAQLAGLVPGDIITAISGQSTRLLAAPALDKLLNRNATFEVYRANQMRTVTLARDKRMRLAFSPPQPAQPVSSTAPAVQK